MGVTPPLLSIRFLEQDPACSLVPLGSHREPLALRGLTKHSVAVRRDPALRLRPRQVLLPAQVGGAGPPRKEVGCPNSTTGPLAPFSASQSPQGNGPGFSRRGCRP